MSITSRPAAVSPAVTAHSTIGPERRASRPTTTGPGGRALANADTNRTITGGVSDSPTIPRMPATLIIRGAAEAPAVEVEDGFMRRTIRGNGRPAQRREAPLFRRRKVRRQSMRDLARSQRVQPDPA